jgi:putative cardiolipin synthase
LDLIASAKVSLDIEYFIFRPDRAAQVIIQALMKKAQEGVKVRILIDKSPLAPPIGSDASFLLSLRGVHIKYFNPITIASLGRAFHRTHRKFIIADGERMITGGRNIGEEYYLRSGNFSFIDRDIFVSGPIVKTVLNTFEDFWNHDLSKMPKLKRYHKKENATADAKDIRQKRLRSAWKFLLDVDRPQKFSSLLELEAKEYLQYATMLSCQDIEFASDRPSVGKEHRLFADIFYAQLEQAKESVVFETPYFITLKRDKKLLEDLLKRKVAIELITNSTNSNNHPMVSNVLNRKIDDWVKKGMTAHFMTGQKPACLYCDQTIKREVPSEITYGLHSKSTTIDDKTSMFITFNLDPQSQVRSLEMGIFCHDGVELAQHLKNFMQTHKDVSFDFDSDGRPANGQGLLQGTSWIEKIKYVLRIIPGFIFAPLL